jgi:hypothetical protein
VNDQGMKVRNLKILAALIATLFPALALGQAAQEYIGTLQVK